MAISHRTLASALIMLAAPAVAASAQTVLLQIRPRAGDTIAIRMEQKAEMTGVPSGCTTGYSGGRRGTNPDSRPRPCSEVPRQMTSVMEVFSRAIVLRASAEGSLVLAVTDSVRTSLSNSTKAGKPTRMRTNSENRQIRVATDGGAEVVDAQASDELRAVIGQMPATLSRKPVAVGEKWMRQMRIPISAEAGATSLVRATFRLDSLGKNGDVAYISMKGTLSHDHRDGSNSELDGWMSGSMELDRRLAWITDTRALIDVESTVRPSTGGQPMRVRTRITQILHAGPVR
ncbi:MAG: hypothetical protein ABI681_03040 [Gemmatimonadales bacterium]